MKNKDPDLIAAIKKKQSIDILTQIIERTPHSIEEAEKKFQELPIIVAVNCNYLEALMLLLEKGADVNKKIKETGKTAIYNAVMRRNLAAARILLGHNKTDITIQCLEVKNTPLHCAIDLNDVQMVEALVSYASKKNILSRLMSIKNKNGHTPDKVSTSSSGQAIAVLNEMLEELKRNNGSVPQENENLQRDSIGPTHKNFLRSGSYIFNNPNSVTINNTYLYGEVNERCSAAEYIRPPEYMSLTSSSLNFELPDKNTRIPSSIPDKNTWMQSSIPDKSAWMSNSTLDNSAWMQSSIPDKSAWMSKSTLDSSAPLDKQSNGFSLFIQLHRFHKVYLENEKTKKLRN